MPKRKLANDKNNNTIKKSIKKKKVNSKFSGPFSAQICAMFIENSKENNFLITKMALAKFSALKKIQAKVTNEKTTKLLTNLFIVLFEKENQLRYCLVRIANIK